MIFMMYIFAHRVNKLYKITKEFFIWIMSVFSNNDV